MTEITLKIDGMSCQHCVMSVKKAVNAVDGVTSSDVSIGSAVIVFDGQKTDSDKITASVNNAGYKVNDQV